jgi:fructosamine-3-kinase
VAQGTIARDGFLLLTYLTSGRGSQRDLGRLVARLHAHRSPNGKFGFDQPYAGTSISFANRWVDSWIHLFVEVINCTLNHGTKRNNRVLSRRNN